MATFVFATGSAFTSLFTVQNIWIRAKVTSDKNAPTVCVDTRQTCDDTGFGVCSVAVTVVTGTNTAASNSSFGVYKEGCAMILLGNTHTRISEVSVYKLVNDGE